jgi:uncharacterized protein
VSEMLPSPEEAIKILQESGCSTNVVRHCKAVANLAIQIAEKCANNGVHVDIDLVQIGALLHDIGRSKTHGVNHPIAGAEIVRSLGLLDSLVHIVERHLGGGISAKEAREFGWPEGTYIPETLEEKIVSYADKLIEGERQVPIEKTVRKLEERLGTDNPSVRRVLDLHEEMSKFCQ